MSQEIQNEVAVQDEQKKSSKASTFFKNAAQKVGATVKTAVAEIKHESEIRKEQIREKPIDIDDYKSSTFSMPDVIKIIKKPVDKFTNSIGYMQTIKDVDILYIFNNYVVESGLNFIPEIKNDTMYYVNPKCEKEFIEVEKYQREIESMKFEELQQALCDLGAKRFWTEIVSEECKDLKASIGISKYGSSSAKTSNENKTSIKASAEFSGNDNPIVPKLNWFANDRSLNALIALRCNANKNRQLSSYNLDLSYNLGVSQSNAIKLDGALKALGVKVGLEMAVEKTKNQRLLVTVEF